MGKAIIGEKHNDAFIGCVEEGRVANIEFERRALVNALRHAAELYCIAAASKMPLTALLEGLSAERDAFAMGLAEAWAIEPVSTLVSRAEVKDIKRRIESGETALADFIDREERGIADLLLDMSAEAVDEILCEEIAASTSAARKALLDHMLTFRASTEREPKSDRGFSLEWMKPAAPEARKPPAHIFQLWYGTNREPVMRAGKLAGFSNDRSDGTFVGQCDVTIPETHKIGSTGSRWWQRIGRGDDRLLVNDLRDQTEGAFWDSVRHRIKENAEPGDAIVFIHGYRVSFEDAAIRAAQIGADLALGGVMAFFSWPSRARVLAYTADEASVEASEAQIRQFLVDFAEKSEARAVHVIAHSMGNRGLLRSVATLAAKAAAQSRKPFGQIILAAPDVDAGLFRNDAAAYPIVSDRTTIYVSEGDLAVRASRLLHAANRIGFAPPIAILPDIDTVNVTGVDLTLLGHGYVGECRPVLQDMHELLSRGTEPRERAMLRERADTAGGRYWEIAA